MDLESERLAYGRKLDQAVERLREVLSQHPAVERIILFGSYARGRRDLGTDLDVIVIMDSTAPFLERQKQLYQMLTLPVDADILCYTPEEFERLRYTPFGRRILQEGVVLYEKNSP